MNPVTFNAELYLSENDDVAAAVAAGQFPNALAHFQEFGQFELRDPNAFFDSSFYLTENPDVLRAVAAGQFPSAFAHFVLIGQTEGVGRAPSPEFEGFDEALYLSANADVAASVARGEFANGFQHFLQFGISEDRPGTGIDEGSQLAARLADLAEANSDVADALEGAALAVNAELPTPLTGSALQTAIDNFDEADLAAALDDATDAAVAAQVTANNAGVALANSRAANSDAQLSTNVTNAIAAARADTSATGIAATELLDTRAAANTALNRDISADGSNVQVATELRDALVAFTQAGGGRDTTVTLNNAGDTSQTVGELLDSLNAALSNATPATAVQTLLNSLGSADVATPTAVIGTNTATASATATLQAELNTAVERADLVNDALDAQTAIEDSTNTRIVAVEAAEDAVVDRQTAVTLAATTAQDAVEARQFADALAGFQEVVDNRDAVLEAIEDDFGPVNVVDGTSDVGTAGDDIFVLDTSSDTVASVTGFGDAGEDVLFVGRGFTQVDVADGVNFATTAQGNVGALEIFVQQQGGNTVLFIEDETFDGSTSTGAFGGSTITLVGVDADDVTIDANGFLRLSEADAVAGV